MSNTLDIIEHLFSHANVLRDIAQKLEDRSLNTSALRLRVVADICDRDGGELAREWNDGVTYERAEAAEIEVIRLRHERNRQIEAEELDWAMERNSNE